MAEVCSPTNGEARLSAVRLEETRREGKDDRRKKKKNSCMTSGASGEDKDENVCQGSHK